ncbi:MAG: PIN domain-containing protein [Flavobacteriales bacterium]|nr:PIN domain-containing protein [Flavobacteriales bacterium]
MKKYFLDTNIILDFLANREPFGQQALKVFNQARLEKVELWTSDNSITTTYYIISKHISESEARNKISSLLNYVRIQPITKNELILALHSPFKDFEDAVQHYCAASIEGIDGIITRNMRDYKHSVLNVLGPEEL